MGTDEQSPDSFCTEKFSSSRDAHDACEERLGNVAGEELDRRAPQRSTAALKASETVLALRLEITDSTPSRETSLKARESVQRNTPSEAGTNGTEPAPLAHAGSPENADAANTEKQVHPPKKPAKEPIENGKTSWDAASSPRHAEPLTSPSAGNPTEHTTAGEVSLQSGDEVKRPKEAHANGSRAPIETGAIQEAITSKGSLQKSAEAPQAAAANANGSNPSSILETRKSEASIPATLQQASDKLSESNDRGMYINKVLHEITTGIKDSLAKNILDSKFSELVSVGSKRQPEEIELKQYVILQAQNNDTHRDVQTSIWAAESQNHSTHTSADYTAHEPPAKVLIERDEKALDHLQQNIAAWIAEPHASNNQAEKLQGNLVPFLLGHISDALTETRKGNEASDRSSAESNLPTLNLARQQIIAEASSLRELISDRFDPLFVSSKLIEAKIDLLAIGTKSIDGKPEQLLATGRTLDGKSDPIAGARIPDGKFDPITGAGAKIPDGKLDPISGAKILDEKIDTTSGLKISDGKIDPLIGGKAIDGKVSATAGGEKNSELVDGTTTTGKGASVVSADGGKGADRKDIIDKKDISDKDKDKVKSNKDKDTETDLIKMLAATNKIRGNKPQNKAEKSDKKDKGDQPVNSSTSAKQEQQHLCRRKYIVREGDTLESIAENYIGDKRYSLLLEMINRGYIRYSWTGAVRQAHLRIGQVLLLPTSKEVQVHQALFFTRKARNVSTPIAQTGAFPAPDTYVQTEEISQKLPAVELVEGDTIIDSANTVQLNCQNEVSNVCDTIATKHLETAKGESEEVQDLLEKLRRAASIEKKLGPKTDFASESDTSKSALEERPPVTMLKQMDAGNRILAKTYSNGSAFFFQEKQICGEWKVIAYYEFSDGRSVRYLNKANGSRRAFYVNLPQPVAREMAIKDLSKNWNIYSRDYESFAVGAGRRIAI